MTKRIMLISSVLLTVGIGTFVFYNVSNDNEIIESTNRDNLKVNSNALTMMYETEYESGEYQVSSDTMWPESGYTFNAELSKCENGSKLTWDDENKKVLMQANTSDKCYVYFDKEPDIVYLAEYIASLYTTDGENGLYLHGADLANGANDNSYRYAGANPNNYVCFGSDEESCPTDNLYRIIGVFDGQVKLIKADYAGESVLGTAPVENAQASGYSTYKGNLSELPAYNWSGSSSNTSNTWSASTLNTDVLNGTYLTALGSEWTDKIATTNWKVGGNTLDNIEYTTPANAYQNEIVNPAENTTYSAKIGLMYVSDYYYGATPTYWTYHGYTTSSKPNEEGQYGAEYDYRAAINDNWMFMGCYDWTISRISDRTDRAFDVNYTGIVGGYDVYIRSSFGVRPSFYLESSVEFNGGSGSSADPYRLSD